LSTLQLWPKNAVSHIYGYINVIPEMQNIQEFVTYYETKFTIRAF